MNKHYQHYIRSKGQNDGIHGVQTLITSEVSTHLHRTQRSVNRQIPQRRW